MTFVTAWKKPWFLPNGGFKIDFIGEEAIDGGRPRREFFTDILDEIELRLFINETDGCGKSPHENIIAVSNGHFRVAGELMAASIVQGGPAPDFMAPWVYDYISAGIKGVTVDQEKVLQEVNSDKALQDLLMEEDVLEQLGNIGYRGVPHRETLKNRSSLIRSLCIKSYLVPKIPMLDQLCEGLQTLGVLELARKNQTQMKPIFYSNWQQFNYK
ncbi:G2 M phase-specific E3 ubiquitin- ligase-like isoform X1 [Paramuricea clavata]|uniref:G2 M phase-specific E3 ubiquitin- ligase-like isoform X1 n=1 Tax=Paramuricea clavata TaxID=317549 RepID=A0A7D9INB2_PARCT|nr:G2 M phase-specific E3 ubiquitin- ligase-like isoform X1 [Paramuricea clavata]